MENVMLKTDERTAQAEKLATIRQSSFEKLVADIAGIRKMTNEQAFNATDRHFQEDVKAQDSAVRRMTIEGALAVTWWRAYGAKIGSDKYEQRAKERGLTGREHDRRYQSLCIRMAWLAEQGIDILPLGHETFFKRFVQRTVRLGGEKRAAWECSFEQMLSPRNTKLEQTVEENARAVNAGTFEYTDEKGGKHTIGMCDCIGDMLFHVFGGKPPVTKPFKLNWSFDKLAEKSPERQKKIVQEWAQTVPQELRALLLLALNYKGKGKQETTKPTKPRRQIAKPEAKPEQKTEELKV